MSDLRIDLSKISYKFEIPKIKEFSLNVSDAASEINVALEPEIPNIEVEVKPTLVIGGLLKPRWVNYDITTDYVYRQLVLGTAWNIYRWSRPVNSNIFDLVKHTDVVNQDAGTAWSNRENLFL